LTLPRPEFEVEPEAKYRFRVINAGSLFCPVQISVDNHTLTLIAADGRAFEPFEV
jgi:FtsP/CotA-like multicopper oxidase with cupredoxin domain